MTSDEARSPWFRASIKPAYPGDYEVRGPMIDDGTLLHWNGRFWGHYAANPFGRGVYYLDHGFGAERGDAWRGLRADTMRKPSPRARLSR